MAERDSTTGNACERCGKPGLRFVAAVPKGPQHPVDHEVFNCPSCSHVQWIEVGPRRRR